MSRSRTGIREDRSAATRALRRQAAQESAATRRRGLKKGPARLKRSRTAAQQDQKGAPSRRRKKGQK